MGYKGKVISGDCHIDVAWLPADLFTSNAPAHLKDKMPYVVDGPSGKHWTAEGKVVVRVGGGALEGGPYKPGESSRMDRMEEQGFYSDGEKGLFHPTTPALRIKDQDIDGVSGEVIYGVLGLAGGLEGFDNIASGGDAPTRGSGINDREVVASAFQIYNSWMSDFCKTHPDRLVGLASLICHSPEAAAEELKRAAGLGLKGGELNASGAIEPLFHQSWDPLWASAAESGAPVSFHTLGLNPRQARPEEVEKYFWVSFGVQITMFQLSGAEFLTNIIYSGACDRYPDFKFVLGECGIGWIPYILHRMDEQYEKELFHLGLGLMPSEYWYRQGYSTFQHEFVTDEMVSMIGENNIIWGSDYPHPDGVWPDSRSVIDENLSHLKEATLKKIVCDNTARVYGFPN